MFFQTPAEPPYSILIERDSASKLGNFFESFVFALKVNKYLQNVNIKSSLVRFDQKTCIFVVFVCSLFHTLGYTVNWDILAVVLFWFIWCLS